MSGKHKEKVDGVLGCTAMASVVADVWTSQKVP